MFFMADGKASVRTQPNPEPRFQRSSAESWLQEELVAIRLYCLQRGFPSTTANLPAEQANPWEWFIL